MCRRHQAAANARAKPYRDRARAAGRCMASGCPRLASEGVYCPRHAQRNREATAAVHRRRAEAGLCWDCRSPLGEPGTVCGKCQRKRVRSKADRKVRERPLVALGLAVAWLRDAIDALEALQ